RLEGKIGIGHTRWATHGGPSKANAHPHCDCTGKIAVVHNGIIYNFQQLHQQLIEEGHTFTSETDTEVIPHLIGKYFAGDLEEAVARALTEMEGSYAIAVLMDGRPELIAARKDSPLIIGIGDGENFIASDVPAVLDYTSRVVYLEDDDIAVVRKEGFQVKRKGKVVDRQPHRVTWSVEDAQKGGYEHFMLKEIHEQPKVIRNTIKAYLTADETISGRDIFAEGGEREILILACGTSYHAALVGKYVLEQLFRVPVRTEIASEFGFLGQTSARSQAVVITQSGETADALKAIKKLRSEGCPVTVITNVIGSSATRLADQVLYTQAGPEISVAATKSYTAQLMALYWMALPLARIDLRRKGSLIAELRQLPGRVQRILDDEEKIAQHAAQIAKYDHVFFIGRGINYPVALEGALKLKEISYIHAEGYAAGELKHGPFALLGSEAPVVAIVTPDNTYDAMLTSIKEVKARNSPVLALVEEGDEVVEEVADSVIVVPKVEPLFSPVVNTVVLQLLAYYAAKERGCPIDFPRNLAKSVTVE
ncbi:MAG: glutamine--fructose-6-phosphate transaminase (isomerizing), partial [Dehalococcoidia bacterium]|nr:glutamine--fructose-6-phosphate transaminase (isomerizing) [Dehalococcoidia bacterium]